MCLHETVGAVDGHSALIEFLSVTQNVFAHLAEVKIEIAAKVAGVAVAPTVDEGVKHPKLHIFYIGCLKVVGVELAHHAAPMVLRVVERSVIGKIRAEVVRTAF